jgi:hypothetical protein
MQEDADVIYVRDEEEEDKRKRERAVTVDCATESEDSEAPPPKEKKPRSQAAAFPNKGPLTPAQRALLREALIHLKEDGSPEMVEATTAAVAALERVEELEEAMKNNAYALHEDYVKEVPDVKVTFQPVDEDELDEDDDVDTPTIEDSTRYVQDMKGAAVVESKNKAARALRKEATQQMRKKTTQQMRKKAGST